MIVLVVLLAWCALAILCGTLLAGIARLAAAEDARMDRRMFIRRPRRGDAGATGLRLAARRRTPPRTG